jgi:hypothetical protein
MNYAKDAAERWPTARILGTDGRFAVVAQNGAVVYLAMTESQQHAIALGVDRPVLVNLHPVDFDKIRDRYDADDRRRERRGQ